MSRLSVRQFMAQTADAAADDIRANTHWQLKSFAEVPEVGKTGHFLAVTVGPLEVNEQRLSMPRGMGQKRRDYAVTVYVIGVGKEVVVEGEFATALEFLSAAYAGCQSPVMVTDPVTNVQTELMAVGEVIATTEDQPEAIAARMGQFEMRAQMRVSVTEIITA